MHGSMSIAHKFHISVRNSTIDTKKLLTFWKVASLWVRAPSRSLILSFCASTWSVRTLTWSARLSLSVSRRRSFSSGVSRRSPLLCKERNEHASTGVRGCDHDAPLFWNLGASCMAVQKSIVFLEKLLDILDRNTFFQGKSLHEMKTTCKV